MNPYDFEQLICLLETYNELADFSLMPISSIFTSSNKFRSLRDCRKQYAFWGQWFNNCSCFCLTSLVMQQLKILMSVLHLKSFYLYFRKRILRKSKVGNRRTEGSLFNSYSTEVYGGTLLLSLDCSTLPLIHTLYCWVLSNEVSVPFSKSLVWRDLGLNPSLPDHWRTLYPRGPWKLICILFFKLRNSLLEIFQFFSESYIVSI